MSQDFTFTPGMSLFVECTNEAEIDLLYENLLSGGKAMMPIDDHGFSRRSRWHRRLESARIKPLRIPCLLEFRARLGA